MTNGLSLDRDRRLLFRTGTVFDPTARRWTATKEPAGEPVGLRDAVRWLQTDSGSPCRVSVAVIGARDASVAERRTAFAVGAGLAALGIVLLCGGKGGVMEAACEGAASAGGMSIGLLPDDEWQAANRFVTIPIATGIGCSQRDHRPRRVGAGGTRRRLRYAVRDRAGAAVRSPGADAARCAGGFRRAPDGFG
jgi:hypothetical protein